MNGMGKKATINNLDGGFIHTAGKKATINSLNGGFIHTAAVRDSNLGINNFITSGSNGKKVAIAINLVL